MTEWLCPIPARYREDVRLQRPFADFDARFDEMLREFEERNRVRPQKVQRAFTETKRGLEGPPHAGMPPCRCDAVCMRLALVGRAANNDKRQEEDKTVGLVCMSLV